MSSYKRRRKLSNLEPDAEIGRIGAYLDYIWKPDGGRQRVAERVQSSGKLYLSQPVCNGIIDNDAVIGTNAEQRRVICGMMQAT